MSTGNPPGPPPVGKNIVAQIRAMRSFMDDPLSSVEERFATYGDVVLMEIGDEAIYLARHPEHFREALIKQADKLNKGYDYKDPKHGLARFLGNGLLTSDGDFWKRQRKLVAPALHRKRIAAYAETMVDYTQQMLNDWPASGAFDVAHEMMTLTLLIVAKTLFNVDARDEVDRVGYAVDMLQEVNNTIDVLPLWLPTPLHRKAQRALNDLDAIVYRYIHERRATEDDYGDLLSMLLLTRDAEDGSGMSDQQARDEAVTIILAGHETTANALNWTWVLLAQHPDIENQLHQELDRVLAGRAPTLADLKDLPYTEMVVKEAMRLYPPAWSLGRRVMEPLQLGEYTLPVGGSLNFSIYAMHHDPRWWDEPEAFRPERFHPDNEAHINKLAYQPFGAGPRICIGNSFAMMEAHLLLATIAQRYRFRLTPGQVVEKEPLITMRPKGGLPMRVEQRAPVTAPEILV